ncbi:MAG: transposase [Acidobacteriota bacterium]
MAFLPSKQGATGAAPSARLARPGPAASVQARARPGPWPPRALRALRPASAFSAMPLPPTPFSGGRKSRTLGFVRLRRPHPQRTQVRLRCGRLAFLAQGPILRPGSRPPLRLPAAGRLRAKAAKNAPELFWTPQDNHLYYWAACFGRFKLYNSAMPRLARIALPGVVHHVIQRGNNQQDVFFTEDDRQLYLDCIAFYAEKAGLALLGYCLMTNHVHLIVVPPQAEALASAVGRAHWRYSQEINRVHKRSGHLWQGRFFSCAMDEAHAYKALAYVERNPLRAGLVKRAWTYPWSSARFHVGLEAAPPWLDMKPWQRWTNAQSWKKELSRSTDREVEAIRSCTRRGRPLGDDRFLTETEVLLGRRLRRLPVGRPRRERDVGEIAESIAARGGSPRK